MHHCNQQDRVNSVLLKPTIDDQDLLVGFRFHRVLDDARFARIFDARLRLASQGHESLSVMLSDAWVSSFAYTLPVLAKV